MASLYEQNAALLNNPNIRKFLNMTAAAEGADYNVAVGGKTFDSYAAHPNLRINFTDKTGKKDTSNAAGRYQFMGTTWKALQKQMPQLTDFSPRNQDIAAIQLIREKGALDAVLKGDVATAVNKTKKTWASFPGAGYNQHERSMDFMVAAFNGQKAPPNTSGQVGAPSGMTANLSSVDMSSTPELQKGNAPGLDAQLAAQHKQDAQLAFNMGATPAQVNDLGVARQAEAASWLDKLSQAKQTAAIDTAQQDANLQQLAQQDEKQQQWDEALAKQQEQALNRAQDTALSMMLDRENQAVADFKLPSAVDRYLDKKLMA